MHSCTANKQHMPHAAKHETQNEVIPSGPRALVLHNAIECVENKSEQKRMCVVRKQQQLVR